MEKLYWLCRKLWLNILFRIKKIIFLLFLPEYKRNIDRSFWGTIASEIGKQLLFNGILIYALFRLDSVIPIQLPNHDEIEYSYFSDLLIAAIGIAGVFLALYCSNMMSVFTSRYINAPAILIGLFEKDHLVNKCINQITNFLISAIIIAILVFIDAKPGVMLMLYCFLNAVIIIVSYGLSGKHSFHISDTYNIAKPLYSSIYKNIDRVTKSKFFCQDENFQNHSYKSTQTNLAYIKEIIDYTIELPVPKEAAMKAFSSTTLDLLKNYWSVKEKIAYDSCWYMDKAVYSRWHKTNDTIIGIALNTGTALKPEKEKDYFWMEEQLLKHLKKCITILINEGKFENIYTWIEEVKNLSAAAVKANCLDFYLKYVEELKEIVFELLTTKQSMYTKTEKLALVEMIMLTYLNTVLSINRYLENLNIKTILENSTKYKNASGLPDNHFFNHPDVRKLYESIELEYALEKHKITPDWYIQQIIAKHMYEFILNLQANLNSILNKAVPKLSEAFLEQNCQPETMLIYSRMIEMKAKSNNLIALIDADMNLLTQYHIEKNIIWPEPPAFSIRDEQDKIFAALPRKWSRCSQYFTLENFEELKEFPDFLGECYNYTCEFLIRTIENNDFTAFSEGYKTFWGLVFLYQEIIREDLTQVKEPHLQISAYRVYCNPILDVGYISSFAYLLGEVSKNTAWKRLICDEFKRTICTNADELTIQQRCERIVEIFKNQNYVTPAIYNRDTIHSSWKRRMEKMLLNSGFLSWKSNGFQQVLDTTNPLLKAVLGTPDHLMLIPNNTYEIFVVQVLNDYLDDDKKYKSHSRWEEQL